MHENTISCWQARNNSNYICKVYHLSTSRKTASKPNTTENLETLLKTSARRGIRTHAVSQLTFLTRTAPTHRRTACRMRGWGRGRAAEAPDPDPAGRARPPSRQRAETAAAHKSGTWSAAGYPSGDEFSLSTLGKADLTPTSVYGSLCLYHWSTGSIRSLSSVRSSSTSSSHCSRWQLTHFGNSTVSLLPLLSKRRPDCPLPRPVLSAQYLLSTPLLSHDTPALRRGRPLSVSLAPNWPLAAVARLTAVARRAAKAIDEPHTRRAAARAQPPDATDPATLPRRAGPADAAGRLGAGAGVGAGAAAGQN